MRVLVHYVICNDIIGKLLPGLYGRYFLRLFIDNRLPLRTELKTVDGRGHYIFNFPDQTAFAPNSKYYLFSIPQKEVENNPNL
ncbi:hypothetical protein IX38_05855 [Chryseobacterium luteum]|uniref:Uncharacterized protein n=1 Tax=Chryseobacterium luteum TaxID=421531 RepID=A0A085ZV29_9FLAO|nr:hypothetical protein IX38_05855 [Chryseobacterium luteum]